MSEPRWVLRQTVEAIHSLQLAEHGGLDGIRDEGLLDSGLAKPKNVYQYHTGATLADMAAAYAYGIARNHAFIDGNKRTAAVVCELLIRVNGKSLVATDRDMYTVFMRVAGGNMSEAELADWLKGHMV